MNRPSLILLLALALLRTPSLAHAGASCPASEFDFGSTIYLEYGATADTTVDGRHGAYDLPHAHLEVLHNGALGATSVRARDAYDVVGVPAGTQVPATVELSAEGAVWSFGCGGSGCWGGLFGRIFDGVNEQHAQSDANVFGPDTVAVSFVITLPVTLVAGQANELEFQLGGYRAPGGDHHVEGTGSWRFLGLPAGAEVVSCQGFVGGPTPARPASWGTVKALYR
jgi:hypothetical protein